MYGLKKIKKFLNPLKITNYIYSTFFGDIRIYDITKDFQKIPLDENDIFELIQEIKNRMNPNNEIQFNIKHSRLYEKLYRFFNSHNKYSFALALELPNQELYIYPKDNIHAKRATQFLNEGFQKKDTINFYLNVENPNQLIDILTSSESIYYHLGLFRYSDNFYSSFQNTAMKPKIVLRRWYNFESKNKWLLNIKPFGWSVKHKYLDEEEEDFTRFMTYIDQSKYLNRTLEIYKKENIYFILRILS